MPEQRSLQTLCDLKSRWRRCRAILDVNSQVARDLIIRPLRGWSIARDHDKINPTGDPRERRLGELVERIRGANDGLSSARRRPRIERDRILAAPLVIPSRPHRARPSKAPPERGHRILPRCEDQKR